VLSPRLFLAQRLSALIMAPLVIGHLLGMIFAVQGGLDSAEILARTRGNVPFGLFYQLFVIAVSIHAAIGIRVICHEWVNVKGRVLDQIMWLAMLILLLLGSFAVFAVTFP